MPTATRTSPTERAVKMDRERLVIERAGALAAASLGRRLRAATLRAYLAGQPALQAFPEFMVDMADLLADASATAHLYGWLATVEAAGLAKLRIEERDGKGLAVTTPYARANRFLHDRIEMDDSTLDVLRAQYGNEAAHTTRIAAEGVEQKVNVAMTNAVQAGEHVRRGAMRVRRAFDAAGVTAANPFLFETLFRTQVQVAYGAGRWEANQDPAVQEILWGYEYVAVGDDRTRPRHLRMNGTRAPKDDPIWGSMWPPNGFNCRCTTVEIFVDDPPSERRTRRPKEDGVPDEGWNWNPGDAHRAGLLVQQGKVTIPRLQAAKIPVGGAPVEFAEGGITDPGFGIGTQRKWTASTSKKEAEAQARRLGIKWEGRVDWQVLDEISLASTHLPKGMKIVIGKMPKAQGNAMAWAGGKKNTILINKNGWYMQSIDDLHYYWREAAKRKLVPRGYNTLTMLRHEETHHLLTKAKIVETTDRYGGWDMKWVWDNKRAQRATEAYIKKRGAAGIRKDLGKYAQVSSLDPANLGEVLCEARGLYLSGVKMPPAVVKFLRAAGAI